jgi:hypothetical protein
VLGGELVKCRLLISCRLGLSDFLRGKLVERLKEEEKKEMR